MFTQMDSQVVGHQHIYTPFTPFNSKEEESDAHSVSVSATHPVSVLDMHPSFVT